MFDELRGLWLGIGWGLRRGGRAADRGSHLDPSPKTRNGPLERGCPIGHDRIIETEHMFDAIKPSGRPSVGVSPVGNLPLGDLSVDQLEQFLISAPAEISRLRAAQSVVLRRLDTAQVAHADGARTSTDWVAARLDLPHERTRELVFAARSVSDGSWARSTTARSVSIEHWPRPG